MNKEKSLEYRDFFNDRDNFVFSARTLANPRVMWNIPFVNQGYFDEKMFVFFGYPTNEIFPQVRTERVNRGVDKVTPGYGKHIVGISDNGYCYNCTVNGLTLSWGTIKVCVVSFW